MLYGSESHEHVLQLNMNTYIIGMNLQFKLQRWSLRAGGYFKISDLEGLVRFFLYRHPRPLEFVYNPTNKNEERAVLSKSTDKNAKILTFFDGI